MGIILSAMGGAADAALPLLAKGADYVERSQLQNELADITKLRDERLQEFAKGERIGSQDFQAGQQERQFKHTDTLQSSAQTFTAGENAKNRGVQREQLAQSKTYQDAMVTIHQAAEGRLAAGATIDNAIKQIGLDNAKRLDSLRTELTTDPSPDRKRQITDEIHILSGKDKDKFLPLPMKDELGNITGYKVFDTIRGAFIDTPGSEGAPRRGERPPLDTFFKAPKSGSGAPAPSGGGASSSEQSPAAGFEQYIKLKRQGGVYIDAPPKSRWSSFNGRTFPNREAAAREMSATEAYQDEQ